MVTRCFSARARSWAAWSANSNLLRPLGEGGASAGFGDAVLFGVDQLSFAQLCVHPENAVLGGYYVDGSLPSLLGALVLCLR
jgi:hypothetical protein